MFANRYANYTTCSLANIYTFIHLYITTNYLNIQLSCRISIIQTIKQR